MANNYLGREDAPIGPETWKALDSTMAEAAKGVLTGRRMLNLEGPYGLGLKAVPLQDVRAENGITTSNFVPLSLIFKTFSMSKRDLAAAEKDGMPINTAPVAKAALEAAGSGRVPDIRRNERSIRSSERQRRIEAQALQLGSYGQSCGRRNSRDYPPG